MKTHHPELSREEIAKVEIGQTTITAAMKWTLFIVFLATIYFVPVWQHIAEIGRSRSALRGAALPQCYDIFKNIDAVVRMWPEVEGPFYRRIYSLNRTFLGNIHEYEDRLESESAFAQAILPPTQYVLTRWLGIGNEKAYRGRGEWLFYRPEIEYLTGHGFLEPKQLAQRAASGNEWTAAPQPDPVKAILQFRDQLARRGIRLIVMPMAIKPEVHPEMFAAAYERRTTPVQNSSYEHFMELLKENGVTVFDPGPFLVEHRLQSDRAQYLATDTHWRPKALEQVAEQLAHAIEHEADLPAEAAPLYRRETRTVTNSGDIALMLKLPDTPTIFPPETVEIHPVVTLEGRPWRSDRNAGILLLGDSFCNIYSLESMGWGQGAGLAEQMSFILQRPVDRLVQNDNGAFASRQMLGRELAQGRDRLAGKSVVVWEFAVRELAIGDWQLMDMKLAEPAVR